MNKNTPSIDLALGAKIGINMNDAVVISLTPKGLAHWHNYSMRLTGHNLPNDKVTEYIQSHKQEDGSFKLQLWELMMIFGETIKMGHLNDVFKNSMVLIKQ